MITKFDKSLLCVLKKVFLSKLLHSLIAKLFIIFVNFWNAKLNFVLPTFGKRDFLTNFNILKDQPPKGVSFVNFCGNVTKNGRFDWGLYTPTKSQLCIPRKGITRPQSRFPNSCVCARFIYPGSFHIFSCSRIGRPMSGIYKSLSDI